MFSSSSFICVTPVKCSFGPVGLDLHLGLGFSDSIEFVCQWEGSHLCGKWKCQLSVSIVIIVISTVYVLCDSCR